MRFRWSRNLGYLIGIAALLVAIPWFLPPYPLQLMVMVGIFSILTLSLNLITGYAGLVSLGQAGFFMVGSYVSALLSAKLGVSPWLSIVAAVVVSAAFGVLLGFPALKLSGHFLAVITIAFGLIMHLLAVNLEWLTGGVQGVSRIPRPYLLDLALRSDRHYYWFVLSILAGLTFFYHSLIESGFGRALKAIREDEAAAACMGVNVKSTKIIVFVISAGIAGLAGATYSHYVRFITPDSFTIDLSIRVLIMMIVGGIGTISGSLVGTLVVYTLPEALRFLRDYYYLVFGTLIILIMLFLPGGLVSVSKAGQREIPFLGTLRLWRNRIVRRPL
jgi:branched-chain amino acid transport system permease protein